MATLATSIISELNQDPQFHAEMEMQYREQNIANDYYRTDFEADLEYGRQIKVSDELVAESKEITGQEAITYKKHAATEQTFNVTKAQGIQEEIFDFDQVASRYDAVRTLLSNGRFQMMNNVDKYLFQKLYDNSHNIASEIDLTALSTNAAKGNAIYDALMDANSVLDFSSNGGMRKAAFGRFTKRYLKDADKLTDATMISQADMRAGVLGMCDGVRIDNTNNLYQGSTSFDVTVKGAVAAGLKTVTVDNGGSGTINAPLAGDTFTNSIGGADETITINSVKTVTAGEEYILYLNKPLGTGLSDDATLAITGYDTDYIPVVEGAPGKSVVQLNPQFETMPNPDYRSTLLRGQTIYDAFLSNEGARRVSVIPVKFRSIS